MLIGIICHNYNKNEKIKNSNSIYLPCIFLVTGLQSSLYNKLCKHISDLLSHGWGGKGFSTESIYSKMHVLWECCRDCKDQSKKFIDLVISVKYFLFQFLVNFDPFSSPKN